MPASLDVAAYERLIASGRFGDERVELLHGELVSTRPQGVPHGLVAGRVAAALIRALDPQSGLEVWSHTPIQASARSMPAPDVVVVARPDPIGVNGTFPRKRPPRDGHGRGPSSSRPDKAVGRCTMTFAGMAEAADRRIHIQVTPFLENLRAVCNSSSWSLQGDDLAVGVECRTSNGAFVDTRYDVLAIE